MDASVGKDDGSADREEGRSEREDGSVESPDRGESVDISPLLEDVGEVGGVKSPVEEGGSLGGSPPPPSPPEAPPRRGAEVRFLFDITREYYYLGRR